MLNQLKDIAAAFQGCGPEAETSVNRAHLEYLRGKGINLSGVGLGNGAKNVKAKDFVAAVRQLLRNQAPEDVLGDTAEKEETSDNAGFLASLDFLNDQQRASLRDVGLTSPEAIKAYDGDLTTLKHVGDSTAMKLKAL